MKNRILLLLVPAIFLLGLVSCQPHSLEKEAPAINEIKAGKKFKVVLPEDHTDGYTWQLNSGFNAGLVEDKDPVWHGKEKGIYFNFNALSAGQTTLTFVKRKYTDTLTTKSFIVKVCID